MSDEPKTIKCPTCDFEQYDQSDENWVKMHQGKGRPKVRNDEWRCPACWGVVVGLCDIEYESEVPIVTPMEVKFGSKYFILVQKLKDPK